MSLRELLRIITPGRKDARNLSVEEARRAFDAILSGGESEVRVTAFLVALRCKGLTNEELTGFAMAARGRAALPCRGLPGLVCISSPHDGTEIMPPLDAIAALIAAGAGARALVVSDRAVPPKRGLTAANVLEHLGVSMTWDGGEVEEWVTRTRFGAIAVSGMLPELLGLRRIREEVEMRTALSTVEKLVMPPEAAVVVGAQGGPVLGMAVEVLQGLGHPHAIAIQGPYGGPIPWVTKRTRGIEYAKPHLVPMNVDPNDFGLGLNAEPDLPLYGPPPEGQGPCDNPAIVEAAGEQARLVLEGEAGPARNAAILGAALMLKACGRSLTLADGVDQATRALGSGAPRKVLDHLRELIDR